MQLASLFAATCALAASLQASALLIRADRDDDEYLELATRYASSLRLDGVGEGVLIAPQWILTAGSVADRLKDSRNVRVAGREHSLERAFANSDGSLTLLLLREPLRQVEPARIYREGDEKDLGIVIVGHGPMGVIGERGLRKRDGKRRAAINTVDRVTATRLGARIKGPDEASDLQGVGTEAEMGRPAYIETRDGIYVAGIGLAVEDTNGDGIIGNPGDLEIFARVSAAAAWIDATMLAAAADQANSGTARRRR